MSEQTRPVLTPKTPHPALAAMRKVVTEDTLASSLSPAEQREIANVRELIGAVAAGLIADGKSNDSLWDSQRPKTSGSLADTLALAANAKDAAQIINLLIHAWTCGIPASAQNASGVTKAWTELGA